MKINLSCLIDFMRADHKGVFIIRETKENKVVTTIVNNVNDDCTQMTSHLFMGVEMLQEAVNQWCREYVRNLPIKISLQVSHVYSYDMEHDLLNYEKIA